MVHVTRRRPRGVTAVAILEVLQGVLFLVSGVFSLLVVAYMPPEFFVKMPTVLPTASFAIPAVIAALGALALLLAAGLWRGRSWGRRGTRIFALAMIILLIAMLASAYYVGYEILPPGPELERARTYIVGFSFLLLPPPLIINVAIVFYLGRRHVKEFFGEEAVRN